MICQYQGSEITFWLTNKKVSNFWTLSKNILKTKMQTSWAETW